MGDSIAINGVCLTVSKLTGLMATFDLSGETLMKTNLGKLSPGSKVNIELALRADERFGGHFVLGHVDGIATIKQIAKKADFATFAFTVPKELRDQMVPKGSVAVDGISLTIAELNADGFTVAVIPQTLKQTILGEAQINQKVNVEIDIITKTVILQEKRIWSCRGYWPPACARRRVRLLYGRTLRGHDADRLLRSGGSPESKISHRGHRDHRAIHKL